MIALVQTEKKPYFAIQLLLLTCFEMYVSKN